MDIALFVLNGNNFAKCFDDSCKHLL
jgi:hypothetical protein